MGVIKGVYNGVKNFINGIKNTFKKISKAIKFFISPIGTVVGWILMIIFIAILLYAIVKVCGRAIDNLFGEQWNYSTYSGDMDFIKELYDSGYEAVIDAENFQDFKTFEYAVLMDAAEYLRHNRDSIYRLPVERTTDQSKLPEGRLDELVLEGAKGARSINIDDEIPASGYSPAYNNTSVMTPTLVYEFKLSTLNQDNLYSGEGSGEYTTENLLEEGKLTGALEPYVYIIRNDIIFSYYFYYKGEQPKVLEYPLLLNVNNTTIAFGGTEVNKAISNANNGSTDVKVFPDQSYAEIPYYTDTGDNVIYKIPLRTLLGRYMPRAELLHAWTILKQDIDEPDPDTTDIVDELLESIKGVYNEECLENEEFSTVTKTNESGETFNYSDATTNNSTFATFATAGIESTDYGINGFTGLDGSEKTDISIVTDFISTVVLTKDIRINVTRKVDVTRWDEELGKSVTESEIRTYPKTITISEFAQYGVLEKFAGIEGDGSPESGYRPPSASEELQEFVGQKHAKEEDIESIMELIDSTLAKEIEGYKGIINSGFLEYKPIFLIEGRKIEDKLNINHTRMPLLLISAVSTWARRINYSYSITQNKFDPNDKRYIIPSCVSSMGLEKFEISLKNNKTYRGKAYRDIFARMKEKDVINTLLQLEQGGIEGNADCYEYMRDVYKLLEASKEYSANNYDSVNPSRNIHENTYEYVYIPDSVLKYDDTQTQKIYWLNLFAAVKGDDAISIEELQTMKTKDNDITWQVVEYEKYPECNDSGDVRVYALSPFGSAYARAFYQYLYEGFEGKHDSLPPDIDGSFGNGHTGCDWGGRNRIDQVLSGAGVSNNSSAGKAVYNYELNRLSELYGKTKAEKMIKQELRSQTKNNPIVAIAPGRVQTVAYESRAGFYVKIVHSEEDSSSGKIVSDYLHMKRWPLVNEGDYVGAGTLIGYEGNTGRSYGSHLHFEINDGSIAPYDCIFPTFNPFYNSEKAKEEGYNLSSEYMSLYRTVSLVNVSGGTPVKKKTGEEFTNQHPIKPLVNNYNDLIQKQGQMDRKVIMSGDIGWNASCDDSKTYIEYLADNNIYDINTKEAFFNKKLAKEQGYLDIPSDLLLALYGSIVVKTDLPNSLPALTEKELRHILDNWLPKRYSDKEVKWLMENVFTDDTIIDIIDAQNEYFVSPVFALAVATLEQQMGLSWYNNHNHYLGKPGNYNIFSIKGTGPNGTIIYQNGKSWKRYYSYGNAFELFSKLIAESSHYFTQGKYTIGEIGATYCPPGQSWTSQVTSICFEIMAYYTGNWTALPPQIVYNLNASDFVGIAKYNISVLAQAGVSYIRGGLSSIPPYDSNNILTTRTVDCSSYVAWCLWEYGQKHGYTDLQSYAKENFLYSGTYQGIANKLYSGGGDAVAKKYFMSVWAGDLGQAPKSLKTDMQIGDIIVYFATNSEGEEIVHHVDIFAGEWSGDYPKVWSCGSAPTGCYKEGEPKTGSKPLSKITGVMRLIQ